ncbi:unnamed protein product [Cylindrotheca closterium]|uniref:Uncharacterized protein n=1 Tax=Cylindrotheca closterium TaxID=2856 RepID=A0AAD2CJA2_9STRA|nr:unnamed protein product [Cylindrotheca closterium]
MSSTREASPPIDRVVGSNHAGGDEEDLQKESSAERGIAELIGWGHISNFLLHQRRLFYVHKEVHHHREGAEFAAEPIPCDGSSFFGSIFLEHDLDIKDFKSCQAQESTCSPKNKIAEMLNALAKIKLNAVTAQIQYQAREKELKPALMQYKRGLCNMKRAKTSMK